MADTSLVPGAQSITYHAWNADRSQIALSPNSNEVWIYAAKSDDASKWEKKYTLDEHAGQVSGIDWCHQTNQIVTCGHDRNAYVWKFEESENKWKPTLVLLRINRAATAVKWSPGGNKFAVASGAKCVPVCRFSEKDNWWISLMLKKHKSTVLSVAWCVNNKFLVTGSTDMKCRILSAYIEGIDPEEDDGFGEVFPKQHEFGEVLAEFDQAKAWVHAVSWAPGGFRLAFASHASTIHFVQLLAGNAPVVQSILARDLPYLDLHFLSDSSLVAAGFEGNIDVWTVSGGTDAEPVWSFKDKVDKKAAGVAAAAVGAVGRLVAGGAFAGARDLFNKSDKEGHAFGAQGKADTVATKHKNTIVNIQLQQNGGGVVTLFTTAGLDGRVCCWNVSSMNLQ